MVSTRAVVEVLGLLESGSQPSINAIREVLGDVDDVLVSRVVDLASRISRLRRRDGELSALISSARELVEVRDVQELLQALVDRANDLMGTDITYLSEYDQATDELFVRASRGAVSPNLRHLRVPAGIGLASKVVHTRSAQWTADYDRETSFPRVGEIDAAIHAEQLRSVLGVPMIAGNDVLGVLFAADRSVRNFSGDEIALLSAFADHAAVVLQTARLFDSVRGAADEAKTAHARAERHLVAMERAAAVHEELTRLVLGGQGAPEVADALGRSLKRPVAVADRDRRQVAATSEVAASWWGRHDELLRPVQTAIDASRQSGRCVDVPAPGPATVVAAVTGTKLLGVVLVGDAEQELTDIERRTTERAGQIMALLTMQQDALADAEERVRGELVNDIISGRADMDAVAHRARPRGVLLDQPWSLLAVLVPDAARRGVVRALGAVEADWLVGQHRRGATVLVPRMDPQEAAEAVHRRVVATVAQSAVVVAASRSLPPEELAAHVEETWGCAELLPGLGVADTAVRVDAYAPYLAMFGSDAERAREFVQQALGPVLDWDAAHGTDLTATLMTFVDHAASTARTARALYVHANTVKQRLDRIGRLLGGDWRDPESVFRLTVALRLHRIGQSNGSREV